MKDFRLIDIFVVIHIQILYAGALYMLLCDKQEHGGAICSLVVVVLWLIK